MDSPIIPSNPFPEVQPQVNFSEDQDFVVIHSARMTPLKRLCGAFIWPTHKQGYGFCSVRGRLWCLVSTTRHAIGMVVAPILCALGMVLAGVSAMGALTLAPLGWAVCLFNAAKGDSKAAWGAAVVTLAAPLILGAITAGCAIGIIATPVVGAVMMARGAVGFFVHPGLYYLKG